MAEAGHDPARTGVARVDRAQLVAVLCWVVFSAAVLIFAAPLATYNRQGGPGPGFFLKGLAVILLALAVLRGTSLLGGIWARRAARTPASPAEDGPDAPIRAADVLRFLLMGAALVAYAVLLPRLGFLFTATALCWITLVILGRHPIRSFVEAFVAAFLVRFAFTAGLGVPLPQAQFELLRGLGL